MEFRDLKAQYEAISPSVEQGILDVLESGRYIGGEPVSTLEGSLANYVETRHCITCGNGTDALQLALMAWRIGEGDAVFVPDFTFFSSGEVVCAVGATPVFVDVDAVTFNIDPNELEASILACKAEGELDPKAVVAVDLFGLPADYAALRSICERHGLLLLEDGAQGFGGSADGKKACSFGDISTTSFFPAKPLGCYGDGGAVFTDDDDWAALVRSFAVHGKESMKYDNVRIGMNSRLDAIQAAVLSVKLDAFAANELEAVNRIAALYDEALVPLVDGETLSVTLPTIPQGCRSSWAQYTVRFADETLRDCVKDRLGEQGIPTMVYYPKPMHEQRAFEEKSRIYRDCSVSERLCKTVLSLPMGPYMHERDVIKVAKALASSLNLAVS